MRACTLIESTEYQREHAREGLSQQSVYIIFGRGFRRAFSALRSATREPQPLLPNLQ